MMAEKKNIRIVHKMYKMYTYFILYKIVLYIMMVTTPGRI